MEGKYFFYIRYYVNCQYNEKSDKIRQNELERKVNKLTYEALKNSILFEENNENQEFKNFIEFINPINRN